MKVLIALMCSFFLFFFLGCQKEKIKDENILPSKIKIKIDSLNTNNSVDVDANNVLMLMKQLEKDYSSNSTSIIKAFINLYKAKCYRAEEDINMALLNGGKALPYFAKNKSKFMKEYINLLRVMAIINRKKNEKVIALKYINLALYEINKNTSFLKNKRNYHEIGYIYFTLANLLSDDMQYEQAKIASRRSLYFLTKSYINEDAIIAKVFLNLGVQYQETSVDSSLYFVKKGIQKNNAKDKVVMIFGYELLGEFYNKANKYDSSIKYLNKVIESGSLKKERENGTYDILMLNYEHLGDIKKMDKYYYLTKQKYLAHDKKERFNYVVIVSDLLDFSIRTKKYDDLYQLLPLYKEELQKTFNINKEKAIQDLEVYYKTQIKNDQIHQLETQKALDLAKFEKQKLLFVFVLLIFISMSIGYYLISNRKKVEVEKQKIELEQRLLLSQMNPHFMFNALSAIQKEIILGNTKVANLYLTKYADLTRLILENSRQKSIHIEDELVILEHYLSLQKIRYTDKFDYTIEYTPELKKSLVSIPPMLIQPFIENSLEHGFSSIKYKGFLKVNFQKQGSQLICTIDDNGRVEQSLKQTMKTSHSTSIVKERLKLLSKETGITSSLNIIKRESPDLGFHVTITIPLHDS